MAALDEVLTPPADAPAGSRSRTWLRVVVGFVVGVVLVAGLAAAGLYAWDRGYEGRVLPGVHAGGIDLSGMTRDQATAAIAAGSEAYGTRPGRAGDGGRRRLRALRRVRPPPRRRRDGRRGAPRRAGGDDARAGRRRGAPGDERPGGRAAARARRGCARRRASRPAWRPSPGRPSTPRSSWARGGSTPSGSAAGAASTSRPRRAAALDGVRRLDAPAEVRVPVPSIEIRPSRGDAEVASAQAAAQRMIGAIKVTFRKHHWTIRPSTVRSWISFDTASDGSVQPVANHAAIAKALGKVAKGVRRGAAVGGVPAGARRPHRRRRRRQGRTAAGSGRHREGHHRRAGRPGVRRRRPRAWSRGPRASSPS